MRAGLAVVLAALLAGCAAEEATPPTPTATATPAPLPQATPVLFGDTMMNVYASPPPLLIDPSKRYVATLETAKGDIVVELAAAEAPNTVNNFVFLAREKFYDNTTFHRVLPGFMAQGGDPTGTGRGGPGYAFADEFSPGLRHDGPGVLSMANSGPNTNGSQFFITYAATPHLDDRHAVFGRVIEGMEAALAIAPRDPVQNPATPGDALLRVTIEELER